jgi:hypothetical protein
MTNLMLSPSEVVCSAELIHAFCFALTVSLLRIFAETN